MVEKTKKKDRNECWRNEENVEKERIGRVQRGDTGEKRRKIIR